MRSLKQKTVHALYWSIAGSAGKVLAQFFIQVWLVRKLGPRPYGEFASLLILISIGVLLAEGGFGSSLVQRKTITKADTEYAFGLVLTTSATLSLLILLNHRSIANLLGIDENTPGIRICSAIIPIMAISNISMALLRRNLRTRAIAMINIISYIVGFGCIGVLAAMAGWESGALLAAFLAQATITLVIGYSLTRHSIRPRLTGDRGLLGFGLQVVSTNSVNWLIENCDKYIIGKFWGAHILGAYSVATNLARTPSGILLGAIQPVAFSSASRIQDDTTRLKDGYYDLLNLTSLVVFPLFAIMHTNAENIILHLYGNSWETAIPLFSVMCLAIPLYSLLSVTGPILWATNNINKELISQIAVAILLVFSLYILRNGKISDVIWTIPGLYLLRFLILCRALSEAIGFGFKSLTASLSGGLFLALVAIGANQISLNLIYSASFSKNNEALCIAFPPIISVILTAIVGAITSKYLISHRVRKALVLRIKKKSTVAA